MFLSSKKISLRHYPHVQIKKHVVLRQRCKLFLFKSFCLCNGLRFIWLVCWINLNKIWEDKCLNIWREIDCYPKIIKKYLLLWLFHKTNWNIYIRSFCHYFIEIFLFSLSIIICDLFFLKRFHFDIWLVHLFKLIISYHLLKKFIFICLWLKDILFLCMVAIFNFLSKRKYIIYSVFRVILYYFHSFLVKFNYLLLSI